MDINERHSLLIVSAGLHPPFLPAHADNSMTVPCSQRQKKMQQRYQATLDTAASALWKRTISVLKNNHGTHCVAEATWAWHTIVQDV